MRNILLLAALASLSACSAESKPAPEKAKTPEEAMVGTYQFDGPKGEKMVAVLETNHNYTDTTNGMVSESGMWAITGGKTCFTSSVAGSAAECYTMSGSDADGTLTATPDKGAPLKLDKAS